jgi:hypothetical protein
MDQQQTCGRGLAENSLVPGKLGELAVAMVENLEAHRRALDMNYTLALGQCCPSI